MRSIINILDLSAGEIDQLIAVADDIMAQPEKYNEVCRHKILATLFFEPSTRTRLSFESAMLSLGGQVIGFSGADSSSAVKGETIADTIEVVNGYADIIAMRHPKEGAPVVASMHTAVPLINAGDGGHFHPTQTLADLLTIHHEKGTFDNLTIGLCGDLKYGRTVHSLIAATTRYKNVKFVLISPEELRLLARRGDADARHTLYDPHPARAFHRRRGVSASQRHICPRQGEDEPCKERHVRAAPTAASQRDIARGGLRPAREVF